MSSFQNDQSSIERMVEAMDVMENFQINIFNCNSQRSHKMHSERGNCNSYMANDNNCAFKIWLKESFTQILEQAQIDIHVTNKQK